MVVLLFYLFHLPLVRPRSCHRRAAIELKIAVAVFAQRYEGERGIVCARLQDVRSIDAAFLQRFDDVIAECVLSQLGEHHRRYAQLGDRTGQR